MKDRQTELLSGWSDPSVARGERMGSVEAVFWPGDLPADRWSWSDEGWTRDALITQIAPLAQAGRVTWLVNDLDRATWPHAKAGFFGVKKKIEGVLDALAVQNAMQGDLFKGDLVKEGSQPAA